MQVVDSEGYLKVKLVGGPAGPFVPYTGATANVDLGEYEIKAGQVEFDQTPTGTAGVAVMRWNDQDGTVDLGLKGGNVTLQVGQEQVTRVVNKTGSNLLETNYQAVRVDGAQGNRLAINLAQANNDANSAETLGLVTETINDNQEGFITTSGIVRNIDTTGTLQGETWVDGNILYLSGTIAGQVTNIKPAAPIHTVIMGYVIRAHATQGQIYVKVDNGYELDELHNVSITTPLNDQVLQYESATSLWKNKTISTGITIGTTAITSGTVGRVLFEGTGNVVQESSSLFWDATNNRLGVGTETPSFVIDVIGNVNGILRPHVKNLSNGVNAQSAILLRNDVDTQYMFGVVSTQYNTSNIIQNDAYVQHNDINNSYPTSGLVLRTSNINPLKFQTNATERLRIHGNTGNVLINTTTDAGFRLDVNGTARVQGQLSLGLTGTAGRVNFARASNGTMIGAIYTSNNDIIIENQSQGIIFMAVGAEAARFSNTTRNLLINTTTDAGFRLDVNGTARVSGNVTLANDIVVSNGGGTRYIQSPNGRIGFLSSNSTGYTFWSEHNGVGAQGGLAISYLGSTAQGGNSILLRTTSTQTSPTGFGFELNFNPRVNHVATLAVIRGGDSAFGGLSTAATPLYIFGGQNTTTGSFGDIYLQHDFNADRGAVGIGTNSVNSSAKLQINSTTKGFLPPRMTQTERNAIASPAIGLEIYQTDATEGKYIYKSSGWTYIG